MQADSVEQAAQPQNDVAPALAARRTVIELAQQAAELGLVRKLFLDASPGEAVQNTKLLLA